MSFVDAGGFELRYLLEGDPEKPLILLSNSLGADISMWDDQMPALLEDFRVLRYDTRGHGESTMRDGVCTLAALGGDCLTLLDALNIKRAHICGVSLGGLTAMWIGIHASQRVRSLVLSNTAARIGNQDTWNERIRKVKQEGLASIADTVVSRWFTPDARDRETLLATQKAMLLRCSAEGYVAAATAIRDSDLRLEIHAINSPTLVLSGEQDIVTPLCDGQALNAAIAGSRFVAVPGAHLSNIEFSAAYNSALLPFLQRQSILVGPTDE